jgi:hypothetical protein
MSDQDGGSQIPVPDPTKLTTDMGQEVEKRAKEYTDLRIDVIEQRLSDMDRATAVLDETVHRTPTEIQREVGHLRELVYAEIEAARRGLQVAEQEREKAAQALTEEREKVAQALATSLSREIASGDAQLGDHITQQVEQLRDLIRSVRREAELIHNSSQAAIAKAEELNKERWESNNKWKEAAADRERSQQEEMTKLSGTFLRQDTADAQFDRLRETSDAQIADLRRQIAAITEKISQVVS